MSGQDPKKPDNADDGEKHAEAWALAFATMRLNVDTAERALAANDEEGVRNAVAHLGENVAMAKRWLSEGAA